MAKRINISIPDAQVSMLAEFDSCCKDVGLSRSEVLVELMTQYVTPPVYNPMSDEVSRGQDPDEDTLNDIPDIPEGLL